MKRIAYLLHRLLASSLTCFTAFQLSPIHLLSGKFVTLQRAGPVVKVISVWKPLTTETTPNILADWPTDTYFILSQSAFSVAWALLATATASPRRFLRALHLALPT